MEIDEPQVHGEACTAMVDIHTINEPPADPLSVDERISMLNSDQSRIFTRVRDHLLHQQQHELGKCHCDFKPLCMFVSGVGGTGKSFLIETIKGFVNITWSSEDVTCAVSITLHRLFQLPIEHEGKTAGYWALPKSAQKVMKTTLWNMKLIIIDEISMISSLNLVYMHLRLFGSADWFGAQNVLFVGDLLQLPPVNGNTIFERVAKKALLHRLGCTTAVNIWKEAVAYEELTINERQK